MPQENQHYIHSQPIHTGVLLVNLGTPDAPTTPALRRYLAEFLWDPRIVDLPRIIWWCMLRVILFLRPSRSAKSYQKIWTEQGSPLLVISRRQCEAVQRVLSEKMGAAVVVELAMRYGNPSIPSALEKLRQANARRIIVLPLYPQYSSSTTASTFDAIAHAIKKWRWIPEFRFINQYHDDPGYIAALAQTIREAWSERAQPQKLLFSFHGTPQRFLKTGDPYYCHCQKTARLVAENLQLNDDDWMVTFQSIFGREPWLQPYTIEQLKSLAKQQVRSVDVVCPGFSADCLETLEEIEQENRHAYEAAGGEKYNYIPALNDREEHINAIADLLIKHGYGWLTPSDDRPISGESANELNQRAERAQALGAES